MRQNSISFYMLILAATTFSESCRFEQKSNMPSINLLLPDSLTVINTKNIPTGNPVLLILFDPDCEHCQEQTSEILKNIDSLKDTRIYFITVAPFDRLKVFKRYYHIDRYSNVVVGRDYKFELFRLLPNPNTPTIMIYDKYKHGKVIIKGRCSIGELIATINNL